MADVSPVATTQPSTNHDSGISNPATVDQSTSPEDAPSLLPVRHNPVDLRRATFVSGKGAKVTTTTGIPCLDCVSSDVILGHKNQSVSIAIVNGTFEYSYEESSFPLVFQSKS